MTSPPMTEKEFARLIKEHSPMINKISYFYATERMPFEDMRQEIYLNIWNSLAQYRGESKLSTWIYRVAVNSALMAIRLSKSKIETVPLDFSRLDVSSELDDAQKENLQTLYSLINRLEDIEKAIILLWLDDYSYDEIAETMGLKRNTVATKIFRIKKNSLNQYNMQLDEIKQNMTLLEQVLAKSSTEIKVDVSASETAKSKLLTRYRQGFINSFILVVVFGCLWIGNVNLGVLTGFFKGFIVILSLLSAVWQLFIYSRLKRLKIARLAPAQLFAEATKIKIYTLSGEIFFGLVLAVFFTLLLSRVFDPSPLVFWSMIATLLIGLAIKITYGIPSYVKLFRELTAIK